MHREEFAREDWFLGLNLEPLQTSSLADLRAQELDNLRSAPRTLGQDETQLRDKLPVSMPAFREVSPTSKLESHAERMVRMVLDRIQKEYAQPLTLRKCARDLRINAAYLSHLFSEAFGVPFKKRLTEVRLEKARELLGDPTRNIAEVANCTTSARP